MTHTLAMRPPKEEQIKSLLEGTACTLVEKYVGESASVDSYAEVFSVTRSEILAYLQTHYRLEDITHASVGSADGFYVISTIFGYKTFFQERGIRFGETAVRSQDEVWRKFVDYLIATSGTGLRFN